MNMNTNIEGSAVKDALVNFIVPLLALVLTVVLGVFVILPAVKNIPVVQAELNAKRTLDAQLKTKLGLLNKLVDFQTVVDEDAQLVSRALVDEPTVPVLLTQVDTIARESGLEVTKLSYSVTDVPTGPGEAALAYNAVIVNLGTRGSYEQMTAFLESLENASRLVDVSTFRFSAEVTEETSLFAGTFILRSPYLEVASVAVTDAPIAIDVSDPTFLATLEKIKDLKFYDINVDEQFLQVQEEDLEVVEDAGTEEVPVTTPSDEEGAAIIEDLTGEQVAQ